jgi:hypothetical protein
MLAVSFKTGPHEQGAHQSKLEQIGSFIYYPTQAAVHPALAPPLAVLVSVTTLLYCEKCQTKQQTI